MARGEKKHHPILVILVVLIIIGAIGSSGNKKSDSKTTPKDTTSASSTTSDTAESTESIAVGKSDDSTTKDWLQYYKDQGIETIIVPADILYEYGSAYVGKTVVTSILVDDKNYNGDTLKAKTENNDTYSFSIIAQFSDSTETKQIEEGAVVIVSGLVDEMSSINVLGTGKTVTLKESHVISDGLTNAEVDATRDVQIQFAEAQIAANEQAALQSLEDERTEYIQSCETVNYTDVERNPSQYKGKDILVKGKVIQVSEGLFNSITMRVDQGNDKIWYVTYQRSDEKEPRILENDQLTFYGTCDGVETYRTVLGSSVTVPSIKAKYYQ